VNARSRRGAPIPTPERAAERPAARDLAVLAGLAAAGLLVACGGGRQDGEQSETLVVVETAGDEEPPAEPDDGLQVEGLLGTIDSQDIFRSMERQHPAFLRCFTLGYDATELVAGEVVFAFEVGAEGQVRSVDLASSTVGHRPTERCLLEAAEATAFPSPRGGDRAEFSSPFGIDLPEDVRPPVGWEPSRVAPVVDAEALGLLQDCGVVPGSLFEATAYVAPGGRVLAAGASRDPMGADSDELDCVAEGVAGWEMPDPGSYPAKVTFPVRMP